jgi:superfamily I DNA/RNA helicase
VGTAGSGKTQLALRLLRDASDVGRKAAYFCFNRPLADHMGKVAPAQAPAETFHEFALRMARRSGLAVDFSSPTAFAEMTDRCIEVVSNAEPDLDLLVIDELQDLQPEWVESLLSRLRPDGKAVLMEDPAQQVYMDRVQFDVVEAVTVTSQENFRSPRQLVRLINSLRLTEREVEALSPYEGEVPDPISYEDSAGPTAATVQAVERCIKRGFPVEDIAVVSMSGQKSSALLNLERIGPWRLRRFTGQFDDGGNPRWTDGELLIDTVRRFKGQAAPAVVLTACDFDALDEKTKRLLFVGITRARLHLEWVLSVRAFKTVLD